MVFNALRVRCMTRSTAANALSKSIWTAKWLRDIEPAAAKAHNMTLAQLMVRAGTAAYDVVAAQCPDASHWLIAVGPGNNGGDGYVMAKLAKAAGRKVTVLAIKGSKDLPIEAATAKAAWEEVGGDTVVYDPAQEYPFFSEEGKVDVVVDGLLGTGMAGAPRDSYASLITAINGVSVPRIAIDIPSGLNAETGEVAGACVRATHTVSFISLKPGLLTGRAREFTGQLHYATLGLESWFASPERVQEACGRRVCADDLASFFPAARSALSHKGQNGKVLLVGGDHGFGGAIIMAAEGCVASGAGLTRVLTRPPHVAPLLTRCPEVMVEGVAEPSELISHLRAGLAWCTAVAIGPGLGSSKDFAQLAMQEVLSHAREHPEKPVVIDADGLNTLASSFLEKDAAVKETGSFGLRRCVVTPHPGEAARLLKTTVSALERDRVGTAQQLSALVGGTCLLKGPGTIVHRHRHPNTTGTHQFSVIDAGNAGMAVGGMGDVLTGVMASVLAQKVGSERRHKTSAPMLDDATDCYEAATAAALVHSVAADLVLETTPLRGTRGLRPTELLPYVTHCVNVGESCGSWQPFYD